MSRGYDERCYGLAEFFLERPAGLKGQVSAARVERLARHIQEAIDSWLEDEAEDAREAGR